MFSCVDKSRVEKDCELVLYVGCVCVYLCVSVSIFFLYNTLIISGYGIFFHLYTEDFVSLLAQYASTSEEDLILVNLFVSLEAFDPFYFPKLQL